MKAPMDAEAWMKEELNRLTFMEAVMKYPASISAPVAQAEWDALFYHERANPEWSARRLWHRYYNQPTNQPTNQ